MNEKVRFILLTMIVPLILITLGALGGGILLIIVAVTWLGVSLLIFHPLEEE